MKQRTRQAYAQGSALTPDAATAALNATAAPGALDATSRANGQSGWSLGP